MSKYASRQSQHILRLFGTRDNYFMVGLVPFRANAVNPSKPFGRQIVMGFKPVNASSETGNIFISSTIIMSDMQQDFATTQDASRVSPQTGAFSSIFVKGLNIIREMFDGLAKCSRWEPTRVIRSKVSRAIAASANVNSPVVITACGLVTYVCACLSMAVAANIGSVRKLKKIFPISLLRLHYHKRFTRLLAESQTAV